VKHNRRAVGQHYFERLPAAARLWLSNYIPALPNRSCRVGAYALKQQRTVELDLAVVRPKLDECLLRPQT